MGGVKNKRKDWEAWGREANDDRENRKKPILKSKRERFESVGVSFERRREVRERENQRKRGRFFFSLWKVHKK